MLESVRRLQVGLHSFLSMRRIEARRKNASAFRLRFSQSLASLRQRLSQAMVRSTIQRFGKAVHHLPHDHRALATAGLARRDQRFDQSPFVVGQIARISQLAAVVTGAVLARPPR
jgi:hypothetical protein